MPACLLFTDPTTSTHKQPTHATQRNAEIPGRACHVAWHCRSTHRSSVVFTSPYSCCSAAQHSSTASHTHPSALSDCAEAVDATPRPDPPRPQNPVPPSCSAARHGRIRSQQNGVPVATTRDDESPPRHASPRLASSPRAPSRFAPNRSPLALLLLLLLLPMPPRASAVPSSVPSLPPRRSRRPAGRGAVHPPSTDGRTDGRRRRRDATALRCVCVGKERCHLPGREGEASLWRETGGVTSARPSHTSHPRRRLVASCGCVRGPLVVMFFTAAASLRALLVAVDGEFPCAGGK
jgi:hypothetical protein